MSEYGIVANVIEADSAFRKSAKAWLANWYSGGDRLTWIAHSRGGRVIAKVAPIHRFSNFRCAWIPDHLRSKICETGTRPEMEERAKFWQKRSDVERGLHPNRLVGAQHG